MVFVKLVVLVLVCGGSGVGLLSVRQSRLQAAHEMAEARLEMRRLEERAGEIRSRIAVLATPDRVNTLVNAEQAYEQAVDHPARLGFDLEPGRVEASPGWWGLDSIWMLDDGTRVLLIGDE